MSRGCGRISHSLTLFFMSVNYFCRSIWAARLTVLEELVRWYSKQGNSTLSVSYKAYTGWCYLLCV